jgi:hypothetical protein
MALTLRHWIGAGVVGCAALVVALLPPPVKRGDEAQMWRQDMNARATIANLMNRDYQLALILSRRDDALAQLRRTPVAPSSPAARVRVVVDARRAERVGALFRTGLAASADTLTSRFGAFDAGAPVVVFATADTEFKAPTSGGRVGLGRWLYLFPEMTDGRTCLVIAPTGRGSGGPGTFETSVVVGPCGYYAAFGAPGPAVAEWLRALDYYPALEPDWFKARRASWEPDVLEQLPYLSWGEALASISHAGLTLHASGCAAGKLPRCDAYVAALPWFLSTRSQRGVAAFMAERFFWSRGDAFSWYLADLVREKGPDRFARFWRSGLPRDSAFAAAFGVPMNEWTHRWLAGQRRSVFLGPTIRLTSTVLGFLLAVLLVAGGAYYTTRRQVS